MYRQMNWSDLIPTNYAARNIRFDFNIWTDGIVCCHLSLYLVTGKVHIININTNGHQLMFMLFGKTFFTSFSYKYIRWFEKIPFAIVSLEHHHFFGKVLTPGKKKMAKVSLDINFQHGEIAVLIPIESTQFNFFFRPSWMQINQRFPFVMINWMNNSLSLRETNWKNNTCAHYPINK